MKYWYELLRYLILKSIVYNDIFELLSHWSNHITNSKIFICIQNRLNKIKYKTGRHKNGETGSYHYIPPFYVIEIVMVVQFYFAVLSLSLSLYSLSLHIICVYVLPFAYIIYATTSCNLFSHQTLFCVSSLPTHIWYDTGFCDKKLTFIGI